MEKTLKTLSNAQPGPGNAEAISAKMKRKKTKDKEKLGRHEISLR